MVESTHRKLSFAGNISARPVWSVLVVIYVKKKTVAGFIKAYRIYSQTRMVMRNRELGRPRKYDLRPNKDHLKTIQKAALRDYLKSKTTPEIKTLG